MLLLVFVVELELVVEEDVEDEVEDALPLLLVELLVFDVEDAPPEVLLPVWEEPPLVPVPLEEVEGAMDGGTGAMLSVMSLAMRVSRARARVPCSTMSRPAWACRSWVLTATYRADMRSTPMVMASTTSSKVKAARLSFFLRAAAL
jgi:hypothetical protein